MSPGNLAASTDLVTAQQIRCFCVLLVLQAVVSYRSVPAILHLFQCHTVNGLAWKPHFTSVIHWVLRLGMARMKELEAENRQLKKMYAEERLKAEVIQEAMQKKW